MRKARATPIMTTGAIFSTSIFFSPWKTLQDLIYQNKVAFKNVKSGTCFSPMWRRLGRWWQRWGRYWIFYSCYTMFSSDLTNPRISSGCTGLGWHAQNCTLARYQGQSIFQTLTKYVSIFDMEMSHNICFLVGGVLSKVLTPQVSAGVFISVQCWILAQDSEIGSLVEPMVWVYIEDIDRSTIRIWWW